MADDKVPPEPPPLPDLTPLAGRQTGEEIVKLVGLMQRLLAPGGCPWDREQTLTSLIPYLIEETYEVVDAVESGSAENHREELGDLLLQVVFQAELRFSEAAFGIDDVARGIVAKLVRRHPHVFGDVKAENSQEALASWGAQKAAERADKGQKGALDSIPRHAPALLRALRAGEKAADEGFDWPDATGPRRKIDEELQELDEAWEAQDRDAMEKELGDVLFAVANLARKWGIDPERALRETTHRFARRYGHMEATLASQGRRVADASPEEQDRLWEAAKRQETAS